MKNKMLIGISFFGILTLQILLIFVPWLPIAGPLFQKELAASPTTIQISIISTHAALITVFLGLAYRETKCTIEGFNSRVDFALTERPQIHLLREDHFYRDFAAAHERAEARVWVCYLAPQPPQDFHTARQRYYRKNLSLVKKMTGVRFRRLVRWSPDNMQWIVDMVDKYKKCPNASLAIIEDSGVEKMPRALSVQIVDKHDTWIVALAAHEREGEYRDIHVKDVQFTEVMEKYFDRLWEKADILVDNGTVTPRGQQLVEKNIESENEH